MQIQGIQGFEQPFFSGNIGNIVEEEPKSFSDPFSKFFDEAANLFGETNTLQKEAEQLQIDFITGKSDDIIGLTMAQSRASTAVQFTSQVTNKILTSYQEIMRLQL